MNKGWAAGGFFFAMVATACFVARLTPFAVGCGIIALVMFTEAFVNEDK